MPKNYTRESLKSELIGLFLGYLRRRLGLKNPKNVAAFALLYPGIGVLLPKLGFWNWVITAYCMFRGNKWETCTEGLSTFATDPIALFIGFALILLGLAILFHSDNTQPSIEKPYSSSVNPEQSFTSWLVINFEETNYSYDLHSSVSRHVFEKLKFKSNVSSLAAQRTMLELIEYALTKTNASNITEGRPLKVQLTDNDNFLFYFCEG